MKQTELLHQLEAIYQDEDGPIDNDTIYRRMSWEAPAGVNKVVPIGVAATPRNVFHRRIRWMQQTMKAAGIIEQVDRGSWVMTKDHRVKLTMAAADTHVIALSTELGIMIWCKNENLFKGGALDEPIELYFTSPPYPIHSPRAYGAVTVEAFSDFICTTLEPIVERLAPGGNVMINIADVNNEKSPAMSLYPEEMAIALQKRLGLFKMSRIIWESNKAPQSSGYWATRAKMNLMRRYEMVYWFTNDPHSCIVDLESIAEPHTEQHQKFVARGGVKSNAVYGDQAYKRRAGDYATLSKGRLPRDVWFISNYCSQNRQVDAYARSLGLPPHAAKMPLELVRRVVTGFSTKGGIVVDTMAGTMGLPAVCEELGRRWVACDQVLEYIQQSFCRFGNSAWYNPQLKVA